MLQYLRATLRLTLLRALPCLAEPPASADPAGTSNILNLILKELRQMSDRTTSLETKVDALVASEAALLARIEARDVMFVQATQQRDAATASLTEAQSEIATLKAELAASPADTTAQEQRLDAVLAKIDGVKTGLDAMELTPAPAPTLVDTGAQAGTGGAAEQPATPDQAPTPEQPAT